mmetsp:Transcript_4207/g.5537  ORF Transcript_4207/g.5537 Transcript_4207/m.5537 type:complete len:219 (+) Transcript_4207:101-757(+)
MADNKNIISHNDLTTRLSEDLALQIAAFLPPQELLSFQCVTLNHSGLDTSRLWLNLCKKRWEPWPRFRLTEERVQELQVQLAPQSSWKNLYLQVEKEATRMELRNVDLCDLSWYLSFSLSGVRGETRSPLMSVHFSPNGVLHVPGYAPLDYEIMPTRPPSEDSSLRENQRGDRPFSIRQWLRISNFPPHFITRKESDAEWLIVNDNVALVSSKPDSRR